MYSRSISIALVRFVISLSLKRTQHSCLLTKAFLVSCSIRSHHPGPERSALNVLVGRLCSEHSFGLAVAFLGEVLDDLVVPVSSQNHEMLKVDKTAITIEIKSASSGK